MGEFADAGASRPDTSTTADDHAKVQDRLNSEAWEKRLEEARLKRAKVLEQKKSQGAKKPVRPAPPEFAKPETLVVPFEPRKSAHGPTEPILKDTPAEAVTPPDAPLDERIDKLEAALAAVADKADREADPSPRKTRSVSTLAAVFAGGAIAGVAAMQLFGVFQQNTAPTSPSAKVANGPAPEVQLVAQSMVNPSPWANPALQRVAATTGQDASVQSFPARGTPQAVSALNTLDTLPIVSDINPGTLSALTKMPQLLLQISQAESAFTVRPGATSAPGLTARPGRLTAAITNPSDLTPKIQTGPLRLSTPVTTVEKLWPPVTEGLPAPLLLAAFDPSPFDGTHVTLAETSAQAIAPAIPDLAGIPRPSFAAPSTTRPNAPQETRVALRQPDIAARPLSVSPIGQLDPDAQPTALPLVDTKAPVFVPPRPGANIAVNVFAPATVEEDALQSQIGKLEKDGYKTADITRVSYKVSAANVRYYHSEDAETATRLADSIGAIARDFSSSRNDPPQGYIELYLKGDRASVPRSTRKARTVRQPTAQEIQARRAAQLKRELINKLNRLKTQ